MLLWLKTFITVLIELHYDRKFMSALTVYICEIGRLILLIVSELLVIMMTMIVSMKHIAKNTSIRDYL